MQSNSSAMAKLQLIDCGKTQTFRPVLLFLYTFRPFKDTKEDYCEQYLISQLRKTVSAVIYIKQYMDKTWGHQFFVICHQTIFHPWSFPVALKVCQGLLVVRPFIVVFLWLLPRAGSPYINVCCFLCPNSFHDSVYICVSLWQAVVCTEDKSY